MPRLNCSADTCAHNSNSYCCMNSIHVGGATATKAASTCCDNFEHKNMAFTNDVQSPQQELYVDCKAHNCVHNSNCQCAADSISIAGNSAYQVDETNCSSFCCE